MIEIVLDYCSLGGIKMSHEALKLLRSGGREEIRSWLEDFFSERDTNPALVTPPTHRSRTDYLVSLLGNLNRLEVSRIAGDLAFTDRKKHLAG